VDQLSNKVTRRPLLALTAIAAASLFAVPVTAAESTTGTGPSTTTAPYVLPVADGVQIKSLLTVGDGAAGNGYQMVGIPDGLGLKKENGKLVLYMTQELRDTVGITRRHGQTGAFVSRYELDGKSLTVKAGSDLIDPGVQFWDYPNGDYVTTGARYVDMAAQDATFGRFCSATLSDPGLFFNEKTGRGYHGQLFLVNEEDGDLGRSFAITGDGETTALPRLGLFSWENTVPANNQSDTTLVMGQEDGPGDASQLWVYAGTKQRHGDAVVQAGLTNGLDYVVDAVNAAVTTDAQWRTTYGKGTPAAVTLTNIPWSQTGAAQNNQAKAAGLNLNRIEDGNWDPNNRNDFYFLTTEGGQKDGTGLDARDGGGLWRLSFNDIERPAAGATLTLLLDGSETLAAGEPKMNKPDNITIDAHGNLLIQEDPGNANHLARIVAYRIADGATGIVARFDETLFGTGATADPARLTTDEESSGIIDTEKLLGKGTFLFDAQIHTAKGLPAGTTAGTVGEFVERGQLLALKITDWNALYAD
jgi:hypothetical protein